jgi:hypothetical protein
MDNPMNRSKSVAVNCECGANDTIMPPYISKVGVEEISIHSTGLEIGCETTTMVSLNLAILHLYIDDGSDVVKS